MFTRPFSLFHKPSACFTQGIELVREGRPIARLNSNGQAMFDPSCLACVRMNDTEYVEMKPSSHQKISYKDGTLRDPGPQILLTVVVFCVVVWNWRSWSLVKGSRVVSEAQESKVQ
ncbi:uncharacterized protein LOC127246880 isoform X2 [Andrographis paniculata]|uniref:uncharacterized protein LOC127246880 isoform X2 n=1 Tax=Andrographis paniculata TaxID=175694 RepID=UPI0021E75C8B|nr:uncharacterized protein LOC127246880 isoform X2 [Andrographis paniculata]